MSTRNSKRLSRYTYKVPTAFNALGGILIGIFVAYCAIFSVSIWNGEHTFNPDTVRGLGVIGLIVLGCSWYESELNSKG